MRITSILFSAAILFVAVAPVTKAESVVDEAEAPPTHPPTPVPPVQPHPPGHYNRWSCFAQSRESTEKYWGYSEWFAAGSGQGQAAKALADRNALAACRRASFLRYCTSNEAQDCTVQRN